MESVTIVDREVSKLFALPVRCSGESYVESLTSYITRLSQAHLVSVGVLVNEVLAPELQKPYMNQMTANGGTRFYARSSSYNGMGETAIDLVSVLSRLTMNPLLHQSTMLPFSEVISSRNLIKPYKAWCPVCLSEMAEEGSLYEPLLWALTTVNHCSKHAIRLQTTCPRCANTILHLERRSELGYCPYCNGFLGHRITSLERIPKAEQTPLETVERLIRDIQLPNSTPFDLKGQLRHFVDVNCTGNAAEAARCIGVPKNTLWYWLNSKTLPTLEQGIRVLNQAASHDARINGTDQTSEKLFRAKEISSKHPRDLYLIESHLLQHLSCTTESLTSIARSLGTNTKYLYKHFPILSKQVTNNYRDKLHSQAISRQAQLILEVKYTTISLLKAGIYPTRRNVESTLKRPAALREARLRQVWSDTVAEWLETNV